VREKEGKRKESRQTKYRGLQTLESERERRKEKGKQTD
jgi:hypothetical protein